MPRLVGFGTFAALLEEQLSEKISRRILAGDQGMIVWWSIGAGVHVEPHSHANEQIVWILKLEFRLGSEQRICGQGDVVVIPGGTEHEA
jgi:quercetin dioxygenase-like cupin family protein